MLPIISKDNKNLICPYCLKYKKIESIVYHSREKADIVRLKKDIKRFFKINDNDSNKINTANYHIAEWCKTCATVWLCEKGDMSLGLSHKFEWDTYYPNTYGKIEEHIG